MGTAKAPKGLPAFVSESMLSAGSPTDLFITNQRLGRGRSVVAVPRRTAAVVGDAGKIARLARFQEAALHLCFVAPAASGLLARIIRSPRDDFGRA